MKQRTTLISATALFVTTGAFLLMGGSGFPLSKGTGSRQVTAVPVSIQQERQAPPPRADVGLPVRLSIPDLKINAAVQYVGTTASGNMDTPNNGTDVAWYKFGARPGEPGNTVLAGHLDTFTSRFGVFMNLIKITVGEDVYVTDDKQKTHHFRVMRKVAYGYRDAPINEIFGPSDKSHLNLITCSGTWDARAHSYTQRTVVYTELVIDQ